MPGYPKSDSGIPDFDDVRAPLSKAQRKHRENIDREIRVGFRCTFCQQPLNRNDPDNYVEVRSWVTGPKLQSPKLRTRTDRRAHKVCIDKIVAGQAPDQDTLDLED